MSEAVYDRYGRMKYNPEYHQNSYSRWTEEDLKYLIDWYDQIGAEEMSFAIGRTVATIQNKVLKLRKQGIMKMPDKRTTTKRIIGGRI